MLKPLLRGHQFIKLVEAGIRSADASDAVAVCPHGVLHLHQRCIVFYAGDVAACVSITLGIGCRCSSEERQQQHGRQSIFQCSARFWSLGTAKAGYYRGLGLGIALFTSGVDIGGIAGL